MGPGQAQTFKLQRHTSAKGTAALGRKPGRWTEASTRSRGPALQVLGRREDLGVSPKGDQDSDCRHLSLLVYRFVCLFLNFRCTGLSQSSPHFMLLYHGWFCFLLFTFFFFLLYLLFYCLLFTYYFLVLFFIYHFLYLPSLSQFSFQANTTLLSCL